MRACGRTTAAATPSARRPGTCSTPIPHDYKVIFVGDASMSPYEITHARRLGRAQERGGRARSGCSASRPPIPRAVWLNPVPEKHWGYTPSISMVRRIFEGRMFPLTLEGLDRAMRELVR